MGAAPPAPLMTLRDLLELACESSCSDGFRSYPRRTTFHDGAVLERAKKAEAEAEAAPAHLLVEADLRRSPSRTLSSILFPRSPGSLATVSRLTRSLSRRLVFWRRGRGDGVDGGGSEGDERDSLGLPSPVVSSCSASQCSEHAESVADLHVPEEHKDESEKPSTSTSSGCAASADDGAADGDGHKAMDGDPAELMEEKQQLSPVSVMDFPFHDEDERSDAGTCSPSSFQQCQHDLARADSPQELLLHKHKARRLDGLAQAGVDVDPVHLRFDASDDQSGVSVSDDTQAQSDSSTSTDDSAGTTTTSTPLSPDGQHRSADDAEREPDEHRRRRLLARVLKYDDGTADSSVVAAERLLLDFLADGLDRRRSLPAGPLLGTVKISDNDQDESALVRAAREWVQGLGTQWGVEDVLFTGEAALADMDRERPWICVGEEEREVGVAMGELLMDALVVELVLELAVRC